MVQEQGPPAEARLSHSPLRPILWRLERRRLRFVIGSEWLIGTTSETAVVGFFARDPDHRYKFFSVSGEGVKASE